MGKWRRAGGLLAAHLSALFFMLVSLNIAAAENRKEQLTAFGTARIVGDFGAEKCLYFDAKLLYCSKQDFMSFGGEVRTLNYSIIFIEEICSGSTCEHPEVSFVVASKKTVKFDSSNRQESWSRDRAKVIFLKDSFSLHTLPEWGYVHHLSFSSGAFDYARTSVRSKSVLNEEHCSFLIDEFLPTCASAKGNCKDPIGEMSMHHIRYYFSIRERNHRFPRSEFEQMCREQCVTHKEVSRETVSSAICGRANH